MFLRIVKRKSWQTTALRTSKLALHPRYITTKSNQTIPSCPSPTCVCASMPEFPDGLEIDNSRPLIGTMAPYSKQLLICTGKPDWPSRIEEENSGDNLAADVKELMGRGGTYSDPYNNVLITNSSFPPTPTPNNYPPGIQTTSAYILPSFKYVPVLPRISFDKVEALVQALLLPNKLHPAHDGLSPIHRDRLTSKEDEACKLPGVRDVGDVLVLICGHGGRDLRCGVLGPVLQQEFERILRRRGIVVEGAGRELYEDPLVEAKIEGTKDGEADEHGSKARVGLISHIGGHKFAGNVILYIPPNAKDHPWAGCGIWYGRVTPDKVEGIINETILNGKIIKDLFRGGINQAGKMIEI